MCYICESMENPTGLSEMLSGILDDSRGSASNGTFTLSLQAAIADHARYIMNEYNTRSDQSQADFYAGAWSALGLLSGVKGLTAEQSREREDALKKFEKFNKSV